MIHNGLGLLGRKVGMTRIFTEDGTSIPQFRSHTVLVVHHAWQSPKQGIWQKRV